MDDKIHIALASDQRYFPGLLVTSVSIAAYADQKRDLCFHILDGGIEQASMEVLKHQVVSCHPNSTFDFIAVNQAAMDGLRVYHGSRMTYARMLLPELLPNVDFLIYSDVDFLWLADAARLWDLRDEKMLCQGVHDPLITDDVPEIQWIREHGFPIMASNYICGGLELMNLKSMRSENTSQQLFDFLRKNPDNPQNDQTAINAICVGRIGLLHEDWMRYSFTLSSGLPSSAVVHYATYGGVLFGIKKPSKWFICDDSIVLWNRVYNMIAGRKIRSYAFPRLLFLIIRFVRKLGISEAAFIKKQRAVFAQPNLERFKA